MVIENVHTLEKDNLCLSLKMVTGAGFPSKEAIVSLPLYCGKENTSQHKDDA